MVGFSPPIGVTQSIKWPREHRVAVEKKKEQNCSVFTTLFHTKCCSIAMIAIMSVPVSSFGIMHATTMCRDSYSMTFCGNYDLSPADLEASQEVLDPPSRTQLSEI